MSALKKVVFDVIRQIRHCKKVQDVVLEQLYMQLLDCALQEQNNVVSVLRLILSKSCKTQNVRLGPNFLPLLCVQP